MHVPFDLSHFAIVAFIFLAAGWVKGVLGMGLPTVAMGLLGLLLPVAESAALLAIPSLLTNVWQMLRGQALAGLLRRLWPMLLGVVAGQWAGRGWMAPGAAGVASLLLGGCLVAYGAAGLLGLRLPRPSPRREPWASGLVGALTGLLTAATGVFVLPAVPYLQALGLNKDEMAQALGLSFTVSTLALAAVLAGQGYFGGSAGLHSLLALLPALVGMALGQMVRDEMSQEAFKLWMFRGLLLLGLYLLWRAW